MGVGGRGLSYYTRESNRVVLLSPLDPPPLPVPLDPSDNRVRDEDDPGSSTRWTVEVPQTFHGNRFGVLSLLSWLSGPLSLPIRHTSPTVPLSTGDEETGTPTE